MPLDFAHGAIQWLTSDALNADKVVSGIGFAPVAIRFYWQGHQSATDAVTGAVNERRGVGFASNKSGSTVQRAVGTLSTDAAATSACASVAINNGVVVTVATTPAVDGRLSLQSFDATGFTLNVDDVTPANLTVFWEAWGGADISQVTIGDIAEPAATGNQSYSATGFSSGNDGTSGDEVVMFAGVQSVSAVNTAEAQDSGLYVGFSTGLALRENIVVCGNSDTGSAAMDTDGYCRGDECTAMIVIAGGTTAARSRRVVNASDNNFTLNWISRATTSRRSIYMAIKGGNWKAGSLTVNNASVNNTAAVSGLPLALEGLSFISRDTVEQTANSAGTMDRIAFGTATGTASRRSMGQLDEDATASSAAEVSTTISYDQILEFPGTSDTVDSAYDLSAIASNGFTVIVDDAPTTTNAAMWIGYLAWGEFPTQAMPFLPAMAVKLPPQVKTQ